MNYIRNNLVMLCSFNDSITSTLGTIILHFCVGPRTIPELFYVLDGEFQYNLLFGWPWICVMGYVPSTLHRCVKFEHEVHNYTILADPSPFKTCNMLYQTNDVLIQVKASTTIVTFPSPMGPSTNVIATYLTPNSSIPIVSVTFVDNPSANPSTSQLTSTSSMSSNNSSIPATHISTTDPLEDVFKCLTLGEYHLYNINTFHTHQEYGNIHKHAYYDQRIREYFYYVPPHIRANLMYG